MLKGIRKIDAGVTMRSYQSDIFMPGDILVLTEKFTPAQMNGLYVKKGTKCIVLDGDVTFEDEFGLLTQLEQYISCTVLAYNREISLSIPRRLLKKIAQTIF